jgi:ribonuclease HI
VVGARMEGDRGGGKGIIFYLEKNHEMSFSWGIRIMSNNQAEALALLQGVKYFNLKRDQQTHCSKGLNDTNKEF